MIEISCHGGQIGRFWWINSDRGGFFQRSGESCTSFCPGRCGWDETWPEQHAWPVRPWGKGEAADDHFRDFAAFRPWFNRQIEVRKLDQNLNILEEIEVYAMLTSVFYAGVEAGQDPWGWAEHVEQQQVQSIQEAP